MDGSRFDSLIASLGTPGSRRRALAGLLAGTLGVLDGRGDDAAARKKPCPPCKKRNRKGKCKKTKPDGLPCGNGGSCQGGTCCVPDCAGKQCGPDGCTGSCGTFSGGATCHGGQCVNGTRADGATCTQMTCPRCLVQLF